MRCLVFLIAVILVTSHAFCASEKCKESLARFEMDRRRFLGISTLSLLGLKMAGNTGTAETAQAAAKTTSRRLLIHDIDDTHATHPFMNGMSYNHHRSQFELPRKSDRLRFIVPHPEKDEKRMEFLVKSLRGGEVDWLALEALPPAVQTEVNTYLQDGSAGARSRIAQALSLASEGEKPEKAHAQLLAILDLAKEKKIPVYCVGLPTHTPAEPSGARSIADLLPLKGRGIIASDSADEEQLGRYRHLNDGPHPVLLVD